MDRLYYPLEDEYFKEPYIDVEEWRSEPVKHLYVHGGFRNTEVNGDNEARFSFYFPEKEAYKGRFFQYLSPAPEDERACECQNGEDDKISFCISHGAYFVVSNQGGFVMGADPSRLYKVSANTAEFSRKVAQRIYESDLRPYGYLFGGSGGSFKTLGCMEATNGVWDGAVPYVMANPMAAPNVFAARTRTMRILGDEGLKKVVAAQEPGGTGDIYEGLNGEQKAALMESCKMGFPPKAWFDYPFMGDGALMVVVPAVYAMCPSYFEDFWTKPGYEGTDPNSIEAKQRVQHKTVVERIDYDYVDKVIAEEEKNTVNTSWVNTMLGGEKLPHVYVKDALPENVYSYHSRFRVLSGDARDAEIYIDELNGNEVIFHPEANGSANVNPFKNLKVGDEVMIDNSNAIAMSCFHRHQLPDESYDTYNQFKKEDGTSDYAQLPMLVAPMISVSGAGTMLTGNIHGKIIGLCSMNDESACPWHGDWYRKAIARNGVDEKDCFRLYYHENSIHDDRAGYLDDPQHQVDYLGTLHQALLDLAAWCEEGTEPIATMNYKYSYGQITLPEKASDRGGMQPTVRAYANGKEAIEAKVGEEISFETNIEFAFEGVGKVTKVAWDFDSSNDWSEGSMFEILDATHAKSIEKHCFNKEGTYYPCVKVSSNRQGDAEDIYTQTKNLARVRVIVK